MYWYVKYPLYIIMLAIAAWTSYALYQKFMPEKPTTELIAPDESQDEDNDASTATKQSAPSKSADESTIIRRSVDSAGGGSTTTTTGISTSPHQTPMLAGGWSHLKPTTKLQPARPEEIAEFLRSARTQMNGDNLMAARNFCYRILASSNVQPFSQTWWDTVDILGKVNMVFFKTDAPCPGKVRYEVQSDDTLIGIANKFETTVAAVQEANDLEPANSRIYPGMILNIYVGRWRIDVSKTHFALILYDNGNIFKVYRVGIGRQDRTPVGEFVIKNRIREPAWTPPGRRIPFGDPENVLGTRWLGLAPVGDTDPTLQGYGIHGTWEPDTIGTAASQGCIRMKNEEVNELFDIIPYPPPLERLLENPDSGTRVTITNK